MTAPVPPAIAPGPPPADPLGKIDPARHPDSAGCYPGCCGVAVALWAAPAAAIGGLLAAEAGGAVGAWGLFLVAEGLTLAAGAWAAAKFADSPKARRRVAVGGAAAAGAFGLAAVGCYVASRRAVAANDVMFAGLAEMLLAFACVPPALGGVAAVATLAFPPPPGEPEPDELEPDEA